MSKPLPSSIDLMQDSWKLFTSTWNDSVKVSIWFLYFGLVSFALALLEKFAPQINAVVSIPVEIVVAIAAYFIGVKFLRVMLKLETGEKPDFSPEENKRVWNLLAPNLWVGILQGLIILGGLVLLVVPGIYFAIALTFAQLFVIDQGVRGTKALAASRDLVKGRWWATFWRLLATGVVFGLGVLVITGVISGVLMAIAGPLATTATAPDPLYSGTQDLLSSIIQAAVLPLFVGLQVKIYRALLATKE